MIEWPNSYSYPKLFNRVGGLYRWNYIHMNTDRERRRNEYREPRIEKSDVGQRTYGKYFQQQVEARKS